MAAWIPAAPVEQWVLVFVKGKVGKGVGSGSSGRNKDFIQKELIPEIQQTYGNDSVTMKTYGNAVKYTFKLPDAEDNPTRLDTLVAAVQHISDNLLPIKSLWVFAKEVEDDKKGKGRTTDRPARPAGAAANGAAAAANGAAAAAGGGAAAAAPRAAAARGRKRKHGAQHNTAAAAAAAAGGGPATKKPRQKKRTRGDDLLSEAAGGVVPGAPEAVDLTGEDDESDPSTVLEGGAVGRSEGINIKQEAQGPRTPPAAGPHRAPAAAAAAAGGGSSSVCAHCSGDLDGDQDVGVCWPCGLRAHIDEECAKTCPRTGVTASSNEVCSHCEVRLGVLAKACCKRCRKRGLPCKVHSNPFCRVHS